MKKIDLDNVPTVDIPTWLCVVRDKQNIVLNTLVAKTTIPKDSALILMFKNRSDAENFKQMYEKYVVSVGKCGSENRISVLTALAEKCGVDVQGDFDKILNTARMDTYIREQIAQ